MSFDRVSETSTTTGTGALTLLGAVTGFRSFASVFTAGSGDIVHYVIEAVDAAGAPSGQWEVGVGTLAVDGTLTRSSPTYSSDGAATACNFSAGTKRVHGGVSVAAVDEIARTDVLDAGETVAAGQLACFGDGSATTTTLWLADADHADDFRRAPCGIIDRGAATGEPARVVRRGAAPAPDAYWVGGVPAATDRGKPVFMSTTAGGYTLTPPGATEGVTVTQIGKLLVGGAGACVIDIDIGDGCVA